MKRHTHLPILAAAATLAIAGTTSNADVLPLAYYTSFEAPTYLEGALVGQDGWTAAPSEAPKTAALVVAKHAAGGSQSVRLDPGVLGGGDTEWIRPVEHALSANGPIVDVGFDMFLERGKHASMAWQFSLYSIPGRAVCSVWVGSDDLVSYRILGADPVETDIHLKREAWNNFRIHLDLSTGTVAYMVNDEPVVGGGRSASAGEIKDIVEIGIRVMGPGDDAALVDSISMVSKGTHCEANCDASETAPVLNINDFLCFVNEYSKALGASDKAASYANFDKSVAAPVLNVNDFVAFMNAFAAGCN
jgi:hypothetical protein